MFHSIVASKMPLSKKKCYAMPIQSKVKLYTAEELDLRDISDKSYEKLGKRSQGCVFVGFRALSGCHYSCLI
jgi:hypothetical protein